MSIPTIAPTVSVVIPCFNAERWIAEAIESALAQTYPAVEVVVIDDGSTDGSLDRIRSFDTKIRWETGPNRGGNRARNRGMQLASGGIIQFLDADDFLLPDKIRRQVEVLEAQRADVVYEDVRFLAESAQGDRRWLGSWVAGPNEDILVALLGSWAPPPCSFLFRRSAFEGVGGWNEELSSAQDWDLHIRLAFERLVYAYAPGSNNVHRRPESGTLSTRDPRGRHANVVHILRQAEARLAGENRLSAKYRDAIAASYLKMACGSSNYFDTDKPRFQEMLDEARRLAPRTVGYDTGTLRVLSRVVGVEGTEQIRSWWRSWLRWRAQRMV